MPVPVAEGAAVPPGGPWRYSRWDGTQVPRGLDAAEVLDRIADDLLYHGDLHAALRRLLQDGYRRDGREVMGLREMLERLRRQRQERLEAGDVSGVRDEIAHELARITDLEREALDRAEEAARPAATPEVGEGRVEREDLRAGSGPAEGGAQGGREGEPRPTPVPPEVLAERRMTIDFLPDDIAGRLRALSAYEFTSEAAAERFADLVGRLRSQLLAATAGELASALRNQTPEDVEELRALLDGLNHLLESHARGDDTTDEFRRFMERFGPHFPGQPGDVEELLSQLAAQAAGMAALLNSLDEADRRELEALAGELFGDFDLSWQLERLRQNLRSSRPQAGWDRRYGLSGADPLGLGQAVPLFQELAELDNLEQLLRQAASPQALGEVDLDRVAELLGPDAAAALGELRSLADRLAEAGLTEVREGRYELTPAGVRALGARALDELFSHLTRDRLGGHAARTIGVGRERAEETKPYEFGDPFQLDIGATVANAVRRSGAGVPVRLQPDDFEVERTEQLVRAATVVLVDLSLSMPMRDSFLAAKKVAMALHALISSRFPRDFLGLVGFSELARELAPRDLPEVSWDFVYGTNIQHALALARRMLAHQHGTKQVILITDGEPTAHIQEDGEVFFCYPSAPETLEATMAEVIRATREGIRINTFLLDSSVYLRGFVEQVTRVNRGRAFYTTPETLGDYVLVDFVEGRRNTRRR